MAPTAKELLEKMTPQYLAGFFDGEGCVNVTFDKRRGEQPQIRVQVWQKQPEMIAALFTKFPDGHICDRKVILRGKNHGWTVNYGVTWYGLFCKGILSYIAPHVVLKKDQVLLALRFLDTYVPGEIGRGARVPVDRLDIARQIKSINLENTKFNPDSEDGEENIQ